jgi:hypothetical protein
VIIRDSSARRSALIGALGALALSCAGRLEPVACVPAELVPRVGVWAISRAAVAEVNREIADAPFSYGCCGPFDPFAYDGETITMKFFREKEWMIGPPGDLYRFESKWIDNGLYWRSTANTWVFLATWEGDHYERWSDSIRDATGKDHPRRRWRFERVDLREPETLNPVERAISGPVGRWNYERERAGPLEHQLFEAAACPGV